MHHLRVFALVERNCHYCLYSKLQILLQEDFLDIVVRYLQHFEHFDVISMHVLRMILYCVFF